MRKKVSVMLVEDDADFAYLTKKMITQDPRLDFLAHISDRASGVETAKRVRPDIAVVDLNLSGAGLDGVEAAKEIKLTTGAKILLLTSFEQPDIIISASKRAFASGYVFKSQCQTLADTIYITATSRTPQEQFIKELALSELTPAERGVLGDLIGDNASCSSSQKTKANQKTSIFRKLGLKNTGELIRAFGDWGY